MELTWYQGTNWGRIRKICLWGFFALLLCLPLALIGVWLRTGINPFRMYYYDYVAKGPLNMALAGALNRPGTGQIYDLLEKHPKLIRARIDTWGSTPTHGAIGRLDSTNILALLFKSGADVNSRDLFNRTPLQVAAIRHDPASERFLLSNGADVALRDYEGFTALDHAAFQSYKDVVEPLRAAGAKMNLYDAILLDDREAVVKLLSSDSSLVNKPCPRYYPINLAAEYGLIEMVELLIHHGAKVNTKTKTILRDAAESGQYELIKLLLDNGADPDSRDYSGETALRQASGRLKTMRVLLSKGADVNSTNSYGSTPLMDSATFFPFRGERAPENWHSTNNYPLPPIRSLDQVRPKPAYKDPRVQGVEPVKLLLEYHANPNLKDHSGLTALHRSGSKEIAELLIDAGADINARDNKGRTPLTVALQMKRTEVAAVLRQHGATE